MVLLILQHLKTTSLFPGYMDSVRFCKQGDNPYGQPVFLQLSQRTLQTVISWIIAKQGKGTVPSIREIQECLVKVGPQFFSMDFGSAMSI